MEVGPLGHVLGKQLLECVFEPGVGDHARGLDVVDLCLNHKLVASALFLCKSDNHVNFSSFC